MRVTYGRKYLGPLSLEYDEVDECIKGRGELFQDEIIIPRSAFEDFYERLQSSNQKVKK